MQGFFECWLGSVFTVNVKLLSTFCCRMQISPVLSQSAPVQLFLLPFPSSYSILHWHQEVILAILLRHHRAKRGVVGAQEQIECPCFCKDVSAGLSSCPNSLYGGELTCLQICNIQLSGSCKISENWINTWVVGHTELKADLTVVLNCLGCITQMCIHGF